MVEECLFGINVDPLVLIFMFKYLCYLSGVQSIFNRKPSLSFSLCWGKLYLSLQKQGNLVYVDEYFEGTQVHYVRICSDKIFRDRSNARAFN